MTVSSNTLQLILKAIKFQARRILLTVPFQGQKNKCTRDLVLYSRSPQTLQIADRSLLHYIMQSPILLHCHTDFVRK